MEEYQNLYLELVVGSTSSTNLARLLLKHLGFKYKLVDIANRNIIYVCNDDCTYFYEQLHLKRK